MRLFVAFCICGLSITLLAQTTLQTFTSQHGVFQFKYSHVLVRCKPERGSWVPEDACMSQERGGVCSASSASTIACFAYPKDKFKDKPTFTAAAFFVAEVKEGTSEKVCLEGSRYWNVERVESARINGVTFKIFEISDNWLGGGQRGPVYRAFHNKKCYELGIQMANSSPGGYDPGTIKETTKQDWDEVQGRLKQALNSFRFLK